MNTSFEFFPPKTEKGKENLINLIKRLSHFMEISNPPVKSVLS